MTPAQRGGRPMSAVQWEVEYLRANGRVWTRKRFDSEAEAVQSAEAVVGHVLGESLTPITSARVTRLELVTTVTA